MWYNGITGDCIGETEEEAREMMRQEMSARDYLEYFQNNQDLMEKIVLVALNQGVIYEDLCEEIAAAEDDFFEKYAFYNEDDDNEQLNAGICPLFIRDVIRPNLNIDK